MNNMLIDINLSQYHKHSIIRFNKNKNKYPDIDLFIEEIPVAISFNKIVYTVMICTPHDLEYFAIGFSLSEEIIIHHRDIHDIDIKKHHNGIEINLNISNRCLFRLKQKRRSLIGITGCGICGEEKLDTVCRELLPVLSQIVFDLNYLEIVISQLIAKQELNHLTGSAHAAIYFDLKGYVKVIFEDLGRHIALDKLVGYINRHQLSGGAILVTSRPSFEMVQKVASVGVEILFAISSATKMAIDLADRLNVTLVGHCRYDRADVYTHNERIVGKL